MSYSLGIARIEHTDTIEKDPFLCTLLGLEKLPQKSTFYRGLERFDSEEKVDELFPINAGLLPHILDDSKACILDVDTTVETVHGQQQGATRGYNPRYRGRNSYQPLLAFDGNSKAVVNAQLRNGYTPDTDDILAFYRKSKEALPTGTSVEFLRADRAFGSDKFLNVLEADQVNYTIKLKLNPTLKERLSEGVLWERIHFDNSSAIEVGHIYYKAKSWKKHRRVVMVRTTEYTDSGQLRLWEMWKYQAIATSLDWSPEDIWHFYNQRCTCENHIKELKYGVHIDKISKNDALANAADLWLKCISYNCLLAMKLQLPNKEQKLSLNRLRRMLIWIPGVLTRSARSWTLHLPEWWRYQNLWRTACVALE